MKVDGTEAINAPRDQVFRLITDPAVLERAVPGCESLKTTANGSYDITLKAGVGSIKGSFAGTIRVENVEAPRHLRMLVDVKGKVGFVKGAGDIDLAESEESAESTLVTYSGDVTIFRIFETSSAVSCWGEEFGQEGWSSSSQLSAARRQALRRDGERPMARRILRSPRTPSD